MKTEFSIIGTFGIIALSIFNQYVFLAIQNYYILFCLFILGIPHGAIDHILYFQTFKEKLTPRLSKLYFYSNYASVMLLWILLWDGRPKIAFWLFLFVSSYHFGEGELDYISGLNRIFKLIGYFSRGGFVVSLSLSQDCKTTFPIVSKLIPIEISEFIVLSSSIYKWNLIQHAIWNVILVGYAIYLHISPKKTKHSLSYRQTNPFPAIQLTVSPVVATFECFKSVLFLLLFRFTGPLVGFATFFGFWHSAGTIWSILKYFARQLKKEDILRDDILRFYKSALPYTIISIMGMFLMYTTWNTYDYLKVDSALSWAVFVCAISVLTGPHFWIVSTLYGDSCYDPLNFKILYDIESAVKAFQMESKSTKIE
jgi:Brp/Blh family beta-carotene 15,15'-monooxygenase